MLKCRMQILNLLKPDDWHLHLRDGDRLPRTVNDTAKQFQRAIIMPNLQPPITTVVQAEAYRARILEALQEKTRFEPLMTLYLTDSTSFETIEEASSHPHIHAFKLYPAGATTHSSHGVKNIQSAYPLFEVMEKENVPLLIHGEVTDPEVDIFDREAYFIEQELIPLRETFPALRIVLEHITTREAASYIMSAPPHTAATITAHHLLFERNALFVGGIKPHYYCLPILKRRTDREALLEAATSGNPRFFLGTDSAPHPITQKEATCGCAGIYTAFSALELYAEAFEQVNKLDKLEGFASRFGPAFYDLPLNQTHITLEKKTWEIPATLDFGKEQVKPLRAGEKVYWKLKDES